MNKLPFETISTKNSANRVLFNLEDYLQHLEGMDLTDEEAREVLTALWDIMVQFVDLGFRVENDPNAIDPDSPSEPCGKNAPRENVCQIKNKGDRRP